MTVRIINADCREALKTLPDESVHTVVSSPPYFGQRDYGVTGQIGLEVSVSAYVTNLVEVFQECRRVLRPDGSLWLNMGDAWCSSGGASGALSSTGLRSPPRAHQRRPEQADPEKHARWRRDWEGLKEKDLIGVPWLTAFALRADGWWLRSCNIWAKANGMPDSTDDRPGPAHEYVFQLSKAERYYYDVEAVKLPPTPSSVARLERAIRNRLDQPDGALVMSGAGYAPPGQPPHSSARGRSTYGRHTLGDNVPAGDRRTDKQRGHSRKHQGFNERWNGMPRHQQQAEGARLRSVWWIAPAQFEGEHYGVMPDVLAAICILAGCPEGGTVLDPFFGAGTTGLVADRLGRDCIGIEINGEYCAMARRRIDGDAPLFAEAAQ